ncbi:MAG: ankyrin repeat domain-containing protein [Tatlockia sp.]|nr:ankyrin repeat domain-containing protein [Tatlockia sp.]
MKLTHQDLICLGEGLGYKSFSGGLCRGFSCMWMQAVFSGQETRFYERLNLIYSHKNHYGCSPFKRLIDLIEEAKICARQGELLTNEQTNLLEILAFYDGICLFLFPYEHRDLFNGSLTPQHNIESIFQFTKSAKLEHANVSILLDKNYGFDRSTLSNYIDKLAEILILNPEQLVLLLGSGSHSVCLKYNINSFRWRILDTEEFIKSKFTNSNYYHEFDSKELSTTLFTSFNDDESTYTLFNTTILGIDVDDEFKNNLKQFDLKYAIRSEHASMINGHQTGLLDLACRNNDLDLVVELFKYPHAISLVSPLYLACQNGYLNIVRELLKYKPDINQIYITGYTPLYIAVFNGDVHIVKELLKNNPDINQESKNGVKPLDLACLTGNVALVNLLLDLNPRNIEALYFACASSKTHNKPELFKLLIDKGAIFTIKNKKGQTALDIAFENKNQAAITVLLIAAKEKNSPLQEIMNDDSLKKAHLFVEENSMVDLFSYLSIGTFKEITGVHATKNLDAKYYSGLFGQNNNKDRVSEINNELLCSSISF